MVLFRKRKASADPPPSKGCDFPLLDLPRELRDLIYDAVLRDVRADFLLARKPEEDEPGFRRPPLDLLPREEFMKFGYGSWDDYLVHEQESGASVLYYRLIAPTRLICASKQVAHELRKRFDLVDGLVASSIHLDRFVAHPNPKFLDICQRSCFAFRTDLIGSSTRFLHTLPDSMRERITSIAIGTKTWLSENMSNKGLLAPVFEQLPALRELAFLVDGYTNQTVLAVFMYEQLCFNKHLGAGQIDVLRLIYRQIPIAAMTCPYMLAHKHAVFADMMECMRGPPPINEYLMVGRLYQQITRASERAGSQEELRQVLPQKLCHEFEEWPGMNKSRRKWSWVGGTSVVKLTRAEEGSDVGCVGLLEDCTAKLKPTIVY